MQIFTYIGPILVSCNPYKALPVFNKEFIKLYYDKVRRCRQPAPRSVRRDLTRLLPLAAALRRGGLAAARVPGDERRVRADAREEAQPVHGDQRCVEGWNPQAAEPS